MTTRTFTLNNLKLVLDTADAATPAMVYKGEHSSSYDCAVGEGTVGDALELSARELEWLDKHIDAVERTFEEARAGNPDYD